MNNNKQECNNGGRKKEYKTYDRKIGIMSGEKESCIGIEVEDKIALSIFLKPDEDIITDR